MLSADKNHRTENVSDQAQNNFRGCRKCSGTFWNFSEKSFAENILSQREGPRSHESGVACLVGGPPRGGGDKVWAGPRAAMVVSPWCPPCVTIMPFHV